MSRYAAIVGVGFLACVALVISVRPISTPQQRLHVTQVSGEIVLHRNLRWWAAVHRCDVRPHQAPRPGCGKRT